MRHLITATIIIIAIWQGYLYFNSHSHLLDEKERFYLISYATVAFVTAWIISGAIRSAGRDQLSREQYHSRLQLYEGLTLLWTDMKNSSDEISEADFKLHLETRGIYNRMALHAGQEVLQCFDKFIAAVTEKGLNDPFASKAFDQLLTAMRTDLGQNSGYFTQKFIKNLISSKIK